MYTIPFKSPSRFALRWRKEERSEKSVETSQHFGKNVKSKVKFKVTDKNLSKFELEYSSLEEIQVIKLNFKILTWIPTSVDAVFVHNAWFASGFEIIVHKVLFHALFKTLEIQTNKLELQKLHVFENSNAQF